jgi:hypothetical protein
MGQKHVLLFLISALIGQAIKVIELDGTVATILMVDFIMKLSILIIKKMGQNVGIIKMVIYRRKVIIGMLKELVSGLSIIKMVIDDANCMMMGTG